MFKVNKVSDSIKNIVILLNLEIMSLELLHKEKSQT